MTPQELAEYRRLKTTHQAALWVIGLCVAAPVSGALASEAVERITNEPHICTEYYLTEEDEVPPLEPCDSLYIVLDGLPSENEVRCEALGGTLVRYGVCKR